MEIATACCSTTAAAPLLRRSNPSYSSSSLSFSAWRAPQAPRFSVSLSRRSRSPALECKCIFGLGVPELAVIAGVAALVFGPKQLPEIGRNLGKTLKGFQQAAQEFETELKKTPPEPEGETPPTEKRQAVAVAGGEPKKELETSSTKDSA